MIKSIKTIMRQDREPYHIPHRVQDVIPIQCVWPDGIFKVGSKFSKTYRFTDINYKVCYPTVREENLNISELILLSADELEEKKNDSIQKEGLLFGKIEDAVDEWEKQAKETIRLIDHSLLSHICLRPFAVPLMLAWSFLLSGEPWR